MPALRGKSSSEQVTLQSSQEEVTMATQSTMERCNLREDRGTVVEGMLQGSCSLCLSGQLERLFTVK